MKLKNEAHEVLFLLFQWNGVPPAVICDNAKDMILGEFNTKLIKSVAPKRLWDDCLKLESCIRSNIAHSIYKLNGKVPETSMSREACNISQFCDLEWFEWVIF